MFNLAARKRIELFKSRLLVDERLGWADIPLNTIQYASDVANGTDKWYQLQGKTGKKLLLKHKQGYIVVNH